MQFTCYSLTNTADPCATPFKVQSLTAYVQVVWLKVELCRLLEEKRSAVLRLELCIFYIFQVKMTDSLKINKYMINLVQEVGGRPSAVVVLPLYGLLTLATLHSCNQNGLMECLKFPYSEFLVFSLLYVFAFFLFYFFSLFCPCVIVKLHKIKSMPSSLIFFSKELLGGSFWF